MFKRFEQVADTPLTFTFDGQDIPALAGDTVAAAMLADGRHWLRNTYVTGAPRGPFCLMGTCFDCLVMIDGETVQACMVPVTQGLVVVRLKAPGKFTGAQ